jgi:hypothetical protein
MTLLTVLSLLCAPGSGSVFDPTTEPLIIPLTLNIPLTTEPLTRG